MRRRACFCLRGPRPGVAGRQERPRLRERPSGCPSLQATYATLRDGLQVGGPGQGGTKPPLAQLDQPPQLLSLGLQAAEGKWHFPAPGSQRQMGEGMSSADGVESQPAWGPADEWARKTPAGSQTGALDTDTAAPAAAAAQQGAGRRLHSQGACVNTVNSPGCGGRRVPGCCHLYSRQASRLDCLSEHIRTRYELLTCTHT